MTEYSLVGISNGLYTEKGSNFTSRSIPTISVNEIKSKLNCLKDTFPNFSHICYAYRIKNNDHLDEFSTDSCPLQVKISERR